MGADDEAEAAGAAGPGDAPTPPTVPDPEAIRSVTGSPTEAGTVVWHREDLRIADNPALATVASADAATERDTDEAAAAEDAEEPAGGRTPTPSFSRCSSSIPPSTATAASRATSGSRSSTTPCATSTDSTATRARRA